MPPDGTWRPNLSLLTVLVSIQVLLGSPNLEDVVRPELISEFSTNPKNSAEDSDNPAADEKENESRSVGDRKRSIGLSLSLSKKKPRV